MEPVERGSGGGRNSRHIQKKIGRVSTEEEGLPKGLGPLTPRPTRSCSGSAEPGK